MRLLNQQSQIIEELPTKDLLFSQGKFADSAETNYWNSVKNATMGTTSMETYAALIAIMKVNIKAAAL